MLGCVYPPCQAQRTAISQCCVLRVGSALVPSARCAVAPGVTTLSSMLVGQSYDLVVIDGRSL